MNLPYFIAKRYLFARKSHNIINVISAISATVIAFVTLAMVVVLSVFNGIENLVESLYSTLDAEIVVTPASGKRFEFTTDLDQKLKSTNAIAFYSKVIEDEVLLQYNGKQTVAILKGVDTNFIHVVNIDSAMVEGHAFYLNKSVPFAILGAGLRYQLEMPHTEDILKPLEIFALPKGKSIRRDKEAAFSQYSIRPGGVFSVNADFDLQYVFVPIQFAKEIYGLQNELTSIEIRLNEGQDLNEVKRGLQATLGADYQLKTREEKNAIIFQTSRTEKWITFFILIFIVVIAAFNILASLTMLIIEKKKDIFTLSSMGLERVELIKVFFYQSLLINAYGTVAGLVLGLGICWAQLKFGLIRFTGSIVEFYPVKVVWIDMFAIIAVIGVIAFISYWGVRFLIGRNINKSD